MSNSQYPRLILIEKYAGLLHFSFRCAMHIVHLSGREEEGHDKGDGDDDDLPQFTAKGYARPQNKNKKNLRLLFITVAYYWWKRH